MPRIAALDYWRYTSEPLLGGVFPADLLEASTCNFAAE
jgi:hypothetical protein